jgi:NAD(P)H-hydrate epimerase
VDGWFGFGLERPLEGAVAEAVGIVNHHPAPVVAIDLPSGLHSDSGQVLGTAIRAEFTLCLGLWKCGLFEESAQPWIGDLERIDFDIPRAAIAAALEHPPEQRILSPADLWAGLPLPLAPDAHKYRRGHLLLIAGSRRYRGAALLAGLGARSSGVGMITLAVPQSLAEGLSLALPEALILACPETATGTIAALPTELDRYDAIACGPGLDRGDAPWLSALLDSERPLLLDADALALCSPWSGISRCAPTLVTPHGGEFRRLWPDLNTLTNRQAVLEATRTSGVVVLRKGPCTHLGAPDGRLRIWAGGSPALARGGSGDVLTGLLGGLMASQARQQPDWLAVAGSGVLWHGLAARVLEAQRSPLGVSPTTLAGHLDHWLAEQMT